MRNRRTILRAGAVAAGAAAVGVGVAASGEAAPRGRVYVLIHGTHANSLHWSWVAGRLSARGHRAIAVDLPGHGTEAYIPRAYQSPQDLDGLAVEASPLAGITLEDWVAHVTGIVRQTGARVVLVGHSQGGVSVTRVAEAIPHLVEHIVYVAAFCCVDLRCMADYMGTPEAADAVTRRIVPIGDPASLGVSRMNWRSGEPADFALFKELIAADRPDGEVRAMLNTLQPDEVAAIPVSDGRGTPRRWGRVPRTYVRFTEDRTIPLALQNRMIREADRATPGTRSRVHDIRSPHYLPRDERLVSILDSV
ncbi:EstC [Alloactinosynnema sp. L-07]|uniref:alpha/beta fold hydrolase n=1 Tax=Alloactinosynnema sp. L-07 TaxID=1653480 RepID=UPI00065F0004|nr:alpha/beta hydrolase [Alloactinosynnema sp. L-07]CRK55646.1 EstC [Alloactinosynnema sp. L-07]